jgi:hypothetical protein
MHHHDDPDHSDDEVKQRNWPGRSVSIFGLFTAGIVTSPHLPRWSDSAVAHSPVGVVGNLPAYANFHFSRGAQVVHILGT